MSRLTTLLRENPVAATIVAIALVAFVVIAIRFAFEKRHHRVDSIPPPSFDKSAYDQRGPFEEYYFVTVPCAGVDKNTSESALIELFVNGRPANVGYDITLNGQVVTDPPPLAITGADYLPVPGADGSCRLTVSVRCVMGNRLIAPTDRYALVFQLTEIDRSSANPSYGGCDPADYNLPLDYYACIEASNTHDADHLVITPLGGGEIELSDPLPNPSDD